MRWHCRVTLTGILAPGFRLGGVFPHHTAYIMTAVTCCFDSSTIVFAVCCRRLLSRPYRRSRSPLLALQIYDGLNGKFGVTVQEFFTGLALLVGSLQVGMVFMWLSFLKEKAEIDRQAEIEDEAEEEKLLLIEEAQRRRSRTATMEAALLPRPGSTAPEHVVDVGYTSGRESRLAATLQDNISGHYPMNGDVSMGGSIRSYMDDGGTSVFSGRSGASMLSTASRRRRRRRHRRSTVSLLEEVLALPPEERALNEVVMEDGTVDDYAHVPPPVGSYSSAGEEVKMMIATRRRSKPGSIDEHGALAAPLIQSASYGTPDALKPHGLPTLSSLNADTHPYEPVRLADKFQLTFIAERSESDILSWAPSLESQAQREAALRAEARKAIILPPLMERTFIQQVCTKEFVFLVCLALISLYRISWYIASTQPYFESIGAGVLSGDWRGFYLMMRPFIQSCAGDHKNVYSQIAMMILPFEACVVVRAALCDVARRCDGGR